MHANHRILFEAVLLGLVVLLSLFFLGRGFGPYWDTWFYYDTAMHWSAWLRSWWSDVEAPSLLTETRHYFPPDQQRHPPLLEVGGGFLHALFAPWVGRLSSARLMVELFAALWSGVAYAFLAPRIGRGLALLGVVLYWNSPRFFLHGVLFAIDGLIAAVYGIALLSFVRWRTSPPNPLSSEERGLSPPSSPCGRRGPFGAKILIGVLLAVALYTKLQALFLLPILVLWAGHIEFHGGGNLKSAAREMALAMVVCLAAAAAVFVMWPALWLDFPEGLSVYLQFITKHSNIPVLYFGHLYVAQETPPWHYPWVFTLLAVPLTLTLPAICRGLRGMVHCAAKRDLGIRPEELLLWMGFFVPMLVGSLPHAPKYDGIRLLLPAYGPLALLAALEVGAWWKSLEARVLHRTSPVLRGVLLLAWGVLVLIPSLRVYPYNLVYYTPLIGGTSGAREAGFDLDYLGVSMHQLNPVLAQHARPGDIVLLAGCNAVVRGADKEGWVPFPRGAEPVDFKLIRDVRTDVRQVFAIISSRYGDLGPEALQVLEEIPPLAKVEYRGERLFSLHRISAEFVARLPDREGVLRVPPF